MDERGTKKTKRSYNKNWNIKCTTAKDPHILQTNKQTNEEKVHRNIIYILIGRHSTQNKTRKNDIKNWSSLRTWQN